MKADPAVLDRNMSALFSDTHPKIEALQVALWRKADPARKMCMLAQLNASARTLALAGLRARYPDANDAEMRFKLASLLLGEALAHRVHGGLLVHTDLEVSERQWRDVIGVLRVCAGDLDLGYLRRWAAELGVAELLERALKSSKE